MTAHTRKRFVTTAALLAAIVLLTGCTRRQLVPGILAGTGAAMATSGAIYRATLDTDEPFGSTPSEVAGTTVLIFGGIGLLLAGIIWSATSNRCEENADCWTGDVCERRTHTCIDADVARQLRQRNNGDDGDDAEESSEGAEGTSSNDSSDDEEDVSNEAEDDEADDEDDDEEEDFVVPPYPG